jgi:hypothetical protein
MSFLLCLKRKTVEARSFFKNFIHIITSDFIDKTTFKMYYSYYTVGDIDINVRTVMCKPSIVVLEEYSEQGEKTRL